MEREGEGAAGEERALLENAPRRSRPRSAAGRLASAGPLLPPHRNRIAGWPLPGLHTRTSNKRPAFPTTGRLYYLCSSAAK
jgi:hypothetical protein